MRTRCCALGLLLMVAGGCNSETTAGRAELGGPSSLAVAGRTLLVASTSEAQLRALDLSERAFVRAPNPIFALAIPTVELPRAVGAWTSGDATSSSPFALVLSTAESKLSLVSLRDLTLVTSSNARSIALPDTALALAVAPPLGDGTTRGLVAVAPQVQGEESSIYAVDVPQGLEDDHSLLSTIVAVQRVKLGATLPQTMVASPTDADIVAVGDRSAGTDGLLLANLSTGAVERFDVGGPVRAIAFEPSGSRLFGVLDSEACSAAGTACSGVFGFSVAEHRPLSEAPLEIPGVARALAVGREATLTLNDGSSQVTAAPLVLVSSANGSVYFVDGASLRLIDANTGGPQVSEVYHLEPDGSRSDMQGGPSSDSVALSEGAARSERISISYAAALPFLSQREGEVSGQELSGAGVDFAALGVEAGDIVEFGDVENCPPAVVQTVSSGQLGLAALGSSCQGTVSFTVRAADNYVVSGSESGYMGRVAPGGTFVWQGDYYDRPTGYDPNRPAVSFTMGDGDARPGATYVIVVDSGFTPFIAPASSAFSMPGSMVSDPVTNNFYVLYEGGNALVELKPGELKSGSTESGWSYFR